MIDLIRVLGSEHIFSIIEFVRKEPGQNASFIANNLNIHPVTVQRVLETLEKYGFVSGEEKRGVGRPSRNYTYLGGTFSVDLDSLFSDFSLKNSCVREVGRPDITFSYNIDKETVNAVLIGGKGGEKIKIDAKAGRFLWLVPPPDAKGETIAAISQRAGMPLMDAIRFCLEMQELGVVEVIR